MTVSPSEHMWEIATRAVVSDDDPGYPDSVEFLACDLPQWEDMLWRDLKEERRATVVVDEDALETIFIPIQRPLPLRLFDHARRRVAVRIRWRRGDDDQRGEVRVRLDRAGIAAMNLGGKPVR